MSTTYREPSGRLSAHADPRGDSMNVDTLVVPDVVKLQVKLLLEAIERAGSMSEASHSWARAEGFVLGLEKLKALRTVDIENLYLVFESSCGHRVKALTLSR